MIVTKYLLMRISIVTLQLCSSSVQTRNNAPLKKKKKNNSHITKLIFSFQKTRNLQLMEMFLLGFFALVINADTWEKGGR